MHFPANIQDCICCIHHYIFVCIYNDVTVYGTIKSNSKNTDFMLSFWSSLTHRPGRNAHQIHKLMSGLSGKREPRGGCAEGRAGPCARGARQPGQNLMKPSDTSSDVRWRICHCRNALPVKSRAEPQSEEKGQGNKWDTFVSCKFSPRVPIQICPDTAGPHGLHGYHGYESPV